MEEYYSEDDYLMLSGLQHFIYCRRQWALIHVEKQWQENFQTVSGEIFHERTHNSAIHEVRKDTIITRGMKVESKIMGLSGNCDVVEFHLDKDGVNIRGLGKDQEKYRLVPIEYKRGKPKEHEADMIQLCAQAMCLEEMLVCDIPYGYLYYGETKRRTEVEFTDLLREKVRSCAKEMHQYYKRGYTPKVRVHKGCGSCSLKDICLPKLNKNLSVEQYMDYFLKGEEG